MTDREKRVLKHLEFIQAVVNRMSVDCCQIKWCSMVVVSILVVLGTFLNFQKGWIDTLFFIPILFYWGLDSYYLWQERLFRKLYNEVRKKQDTNLEMNVREQMVSCNWLNAFFSVSLIVFYLIQIAFLIFVFILIR